MQHCIELIQYFDETKCYMLYHKLCLHNQDEEVFLFIYPVLYIFYVQSKI